MTSSNLLLRYVFSCTYPFSKIMNKLTSPLTSVPEAYLRGCILGYQFSSVQRDGMGRKRVGGSGWGNQVHLWLIHVYVWKTHHNIVK